MKLKWSFPDLISRLPSLDTEVYAMPSKSHPRNDFTMSSGDAGLSSELKKRSTSKPVKEKALSPRTSRKFREKAKAEYHIRPPHAGLPFEFVKKGESGVVSQKRTEGKRESNEEKRPVKNESKDGELVKHMSSLPGFLQQGEKPQDKILNFGVLDWERLEQWKHKQKRSSGRSRTASGSVAGSSSSASMKISSVASGAVKSEVQQDSYPQIHASAKVDPSHGALPDTSMVSSSHDFGNTEKNCPDGQRRIRRDKPRHRGHQEKKSHKTKGEMEMLSSKLNSHNVSISKENTSDDRPDKKMEKCKQPELDPGHQNHHRKQDSVVLLLPKDFSQSGRLDESQCPVLNRNSVELNWSSFSDVFSIEELRFEELSSDVSHSCPLPSMEDAETELDVNLDSLVRGQRMQLPPRQPTLSSFLNHSLSSSCEVRHNGDNEGEVTSSIASEACNSSDFTSSNDKDPSLAQQFSSGIGRLTRSLSFKEGSGLPQLKHASIRSGPAEALNFRDNSTDETFNGRSKINPFKRFLDPILKPKTAKPDNAVDDSMPCLEDLKNLSIKDTNGRSGSTTIKAVLQLSVKSGLPLFKFLVESSNEIFASTVKRLSTLEKNDPSWLYTFYSVQEVKRRKSSSWLHHGSKGKASDFSYNVIGQMKVSSPLPYGEHDLEERFTRESVLYGVDVTKVEEAGLKSAVNKELGAVVVEVSKEASVGDQWSSVVVILPGVAHSLPNEGVPASLIDRWRTGGVCDCGGWDVGCSLQVLTNKDEDEKISKPSNAYPFQHHCSLFLQGCGKQNKPNFTVAALGEGVYSIEYDTTISSLQAFATSVALLSDQKQASLSHASIHGEERKGHYRSRSSVEGARFATNPPHSPVGRA